MTNFINRKFHAYIDYPVALGLLALPVILGLGSSNPLAFWLSVATGGAAFILTLITDHETGVFRVLPYKLHLAVDGLVGVVFVVAPFILGFSGLDALYYWVMGATVIAVVALDSTSKTNEIAA